MGTKAQIGIVTKNGKVKNVYLGHHGYVEHAGKILQEHYSSTEKANALIDGGWMSIIKPEMKPEDYYFPTGEGNKNIKMDEHVGAYWLRCREDVFIEYAYLWDGEKWLVWGEDY